EVVGVIGDPVAHSLSPRLHNAAFDALGLDWVSVGFRVPAGQAATALTGAAALGLRGLSVTMPHKEAAARAVDRLGIEAAALDAVNCVVFDEGRTVGENTDGAGLVAALRRGSGFEPEGQRCCVVGAGGAGRAAVLGLAGAGAAEVVVLNRTRARAEAAVALAGGAGRLGTPEDAATCQLVVNATPLGMADAGGGDAWPLEPAFLHPGQVVVDLVYHPRRTRWLQAAEGVGAAVHNGIGMLVHQAALQVTRWTGREAPVEAMWAAVPADDEEPS
ncbi:MAG: shikimate dehydrogenase, partial [Acidimicrobiales bacterium]|nr:shikimate dehydrogenase [Acidimicrobiales bacterium]